MRMSAYLRWHLILMCESMDLAVLSDFHRDLSSDFVLDAMLKYDRQTLRLI